MANHAVESEGLLALFHSFSGSPQWVFVSLAANSQMMFGPSNQSGFESSRQLHFASREGSAHCGKGNSFSSRCIVAEFAFQSVQ
jgi:hypothetical protein